MVTSEVEANKIRILEAIAAEGAGCEPALATHYRYDPNDDSNASMRAAIAEMVFGQVGSFARQMMVRVVGREGTIDDAPYLALLLDSSTREDFPYPFRNATEYGGMQHFSDSDAKVREAAAEAIGKIIARGANVRGSALIGNGMGRALIRCALLDESEKARGNAAEILWAHSDKITILTLIKELADADNGGNPHLYARAEEAVKRSVEAMGKARVRGTALGPLIDAALEDGKAGVVCSDIVVRLAGMEAEVAGWVKKRRAATGKDEGIGDEERARRVRRLTALIGRIGIVSGKEDVPAPQQLKGAPGEKPTRNMRLMTVLAEKDEGPLQLPGDRIGNWWRRRKYMKERKKIEKMREQERKIRIEGKK